MDIPKNVDMQVIDYDKRLIHCLKDFSDDFHDLPEEDIAVVHDKSLTVKAWKTAKGWLGSGAAWGCNIPGVAMDCAGSALSLLIDAGLVKIPPGMKQMMAGAHARSGELEQDARELNRRLQAFLAYVLLRCAAPGYMFVPVANPEKVYPLDIFVTPYTWSINGRVMLPHVMVCARDQQFLTANQETGVLHLIDVEDGARMATHVEGVPEEDLIAGFALRFYRGTPDEYYIYHREKSLKLARQYHKELKRIHEK